MMDGSNELGRRIRNGVILAVCAVLLLFALQNSESVTVAFLFWESTMPRAVVLFIFFCAGVLLGLLLGRSLRKPRE